MLRKKNGPIESVRGPTATELGGSTDVGMLLNQCLGMIADEAASAVATEVAGQVNPLQANLEKLAGALQLVQKGQRDLDGRVQDLVSQSQLLEKASQERRQLSQEHYQHHVIEPMVRLLFPIVDVLEKAKGIKGANSIYIDKVQWAAIEQIQVYVNQFLGAHDITIVKSRSGARFNPKIMKPVQCVACRDSDRDSCVVESLQSGFIHGTGRVLRFESVALYRYQKPIENSSRYSKETSHGTCD